MNPAEAAVAPAEEQSPRSDVPPAASAKGTPQAEIESESGHELFRLFVGGLPKHFHEADLRPMFAKYGSLKQVSVLREPDGSSKGCGFILYERRDDAEKAIAALDKNITLPGQLQPIEVRFAKKPALVQPGTGPQDNRQLFFSGGPPGVVRKDVLQLFSYYGKVDHVHLFMDFRTKSSKGCGFVTFSTRKAAEDAMKALDQTYTMPGGRMVLTVRWADPDLQERKRRASEGLAEDQRQLFVAKVLKSSLEEDVQALFSHYGTVEKVAMFKPAPDAVFHKGCGVVTMARREDAEAALRALDETYIWPGMHEPLVVKWMDADFNKRKRFEPSMPQFMSVEPPPPGCDADALKLYVGNIPTTYSVDDIRQVFKQYGRVIQILIARDKETHQPKGSAYVWYQRRRESELAIKRLNGSATAMPDPTNQPARPLLVTVAQQSVAPVRPGQLNPQMGGPMAQPAMFGSMGLGGGMAPMGSQRFGGPPQQPLHMMQQHAQQQMMPPQQQRVPPQLPLSSYAPQQEQQAEGYGGKEVWDQGYGPASYDPNAYYDQSAYGPAAGGYGGPVQQGGGSYDQQGGGYGGPAQQQPQQLQQGVMGGVGIVGPQGNYGAPHQAVAGLVTAYRGPTSYPATATARGSFPAQGGYWPPQEQAGGYGGSAGYDQSVSGSYAAPRQDQGEYGAGLYGAPLAPQGVMQQGLPQHAQQGQYLAYAAPQQPMGGYVAYGQ